MLKIIFPHDVRGHGTGVDLFPEVIISLPLRGTVCVLLHRQVFLEDRIPRLIHLVREIKRVLSVCSGGLIESDLAELVTELDVLS